MNDYDVFHKLVVNDPGLLQKVDQARLIVRLKNTGNENVGFINIPVVTYSMGCNADNEKDPWDIYKFQ